jgi:hypothetical protein
MIKLALFSIAALVVLIWGADRLVKLNDWIQTNKAKRAGCVPHRKELDRPL